MSMHAALLLVAAVVLASGCVSEEPQYGEVVYMGNMTLLSPSFTDNGSIPAKFTCQGEDVNPELRISGVPDNTESLALIVDDPDASMGTWDHWVVFNVPPGISKIPEGRAPEEATLGRNSWGKGKYGGPCPPSGTHRYMFRLYALNTTLPLDSSANKRDVQAAMQGHVLAQAMLKGLYMKS